MNALVTGAELAQLLRPNDPVSRETIRLWTHKGLIPRSAIVFNGRHVMYSTPRLIAAGWLHPEPGPDKKVTAG